MIAALIIMFREIVEAGLIVGIVLAATRNVAGRGPWITGGLAAGVAGCAAGASAAVLVPGTISLAPSLTLAVGSRRLALASSATGT